MRPKYEAGAALGGRTADACTPVKGDQLAAEVTWEEKNVADLLDQKVILTFTITNASLYSFWFED